jgi:hypothetical protein
MIKKSNGERAPFDPNKIKTSIKRAGGDIQTQERILKLVEKKLRPGITTEEIYSLVHSELSKAEPSTGARYRLRSGLLRLGPAGYNFEKYVASILNRYGYKTELPFELQGACVSHEVDVIAEKDGRKMFIEAKFRNKFDDVVNIKDTMATWSRYLDLVEGARLGLCPHFDEAWIVTNARFTSHSLKFAHCKNMVMVGWNHPKERTFAKMVDLQTLYPLTILDDISDQEIHTFADHELMLCQEIAHQDVKTLEKKTGLKQKRLKELVNQCQIIIS